MKAQSLAALIPAALADNPDAIEELHTRCAEIASARQASEILLTTWPAHAAAVEEWLHLIVEMHAELAAPIGRELREKAVVGGGGVEAPRERAGQTPR